MNDSESKEQIFLRACEHHKNENFEVAESDYQKAAKLGHVKAYTNLSELYFKGHGVVKDRLKGLSYLVVGAEGGHDRAQLDLAERLEYGEDVPTDAKGCRYWYWRLATNPNLTERYESDVKEKCCQYKITTKDVPELPGKPYVLLKDELEQLLSSGAQANNLNCDSREQQNACNDLHQPMRERVSTLGHFPDKVFPKLDRVTDTILGKGSYGEVRLAEHANQQVAVKTFSSEQSYEACKQEASLLCTFMHSSIVRFMGITNTLPHFLVMEYLPGGTLRKWLNDQPKETVAPLVYFKMALDIAAAIAYLHENINSNCVVHGDIKADNVLLARQSIQGDEPTQILREHTSVLAKLTDFGSARVIQYRFFASSSLPASKKQELGTWQYRAPELFSENEQSTLAGDVYSFAWVLWELATHAVPFAKIDYSLGKKKILQGERGTPAFEPQIDLEKLFHQLIENGWHEDAKKRAQAGDILKQLQSIFKEALNDDSAAKPPQQRTQLKKAALKQQSPTRNASSAASKARQMSINEMPNEMKLCTTNVSQPARRSETTTTRPISRTDSARASNPGGATTSSSSRFSDSTKLAGAYDADTKGAYVKPGEHKSPPPVQSVFRGLTPKARGISFSEGSDDSTKKPSPKPR